MLACDAKNRHVKKDRAMRNACDSDSPCGLACDASARDAKSLAMRVERCEPLRAAPRPSLFGGGPPVCLESLEKCQLPFLWSGLPVKRIVREVV